jgi:hypothetical protein
MLHRSNSRRKIDRLTLRIHAVAPESRLFRARAQHPLLFRLALS